jgi:hypothetical protein
MNAVPENVIDEPSMTIDEFCFSERWSRATFFKMQRLGVAPPTYRLPGTNIVRISARARREWREHMEKFAQEEAAQQERERRADHARRAGQAAARSEHHVSKTRKRRIA